MKMPNRIKNLAIVLLIMLAVFQTGRLWFVNITNRNFFYTYFMSIVNPVIPDGHSDIVCPYRIISGTSDGKFNIHYSNLSNLSEKEYGDAVFAAILKSGEYAGAGQIDYQRLLGRPLYIFEYAFPMPADIFTRAYNQRPNVLTSRGIETFTGIALQPPTEDDEALHVFFINGGDAVEFTLNKNNRQEPATRYAYEIPSTDTTNIYYVCAALEGADTSEPFLFIARWDEGTPAYKPITVTNPYANAYGETLISNIQSKVEVFFDNPATINAKPAADGVYTFTSANAVVRYYSRDVLEYAGFYAYDRSGAANFMTDYSAALSFIMYKDPYIVNETFLAGYEVVDNQHVFYFDYVINDLPLIMPDGRTSAMESGHPIEVTVDHGTVAKYKKLVYNFHIDENDTLTGRLDYNRLADSLNQQEITRLTLGYRIDNPRWLSLYWFVEMGEVRLVKSAGN